MLTQSEREWLYRRELIYKWDGWYVWDGYYEPDTELENWQDAAEFEARVAAWLAEAFMYILHDAPGDHIQDMPCDDCPVKECKLDCKDSILKWARLTVEEEMDAER